MIASRLLDTSALLTLLGDEPGAARVEEVLRQENVLIPFVALIETYYITLQTASPVEAEKRHALLKALPAEVLWAVDEATALTAAKLKAGHRLPFADALIAAFAVTRGAVLVHKDRHFDSLAAQVALEPLPYAPARRRG
ncbi:MAG: PIN domain-containing protein [Candidatus Bipolaricaulota bacterium]